ncbi:MAG: class I SAM-dependent methyltransferase, partial [Gemmatimonadales bacterium]
FEGATINWIARLAQGPIYGFDSFEGLPESWRPGFDAGRFRVKRLPWVRPNVRLIKGWFSDTIPPFALEHPEPIGFLHVDCDLYSSTRTIFEGLSPRLRPGSVIVFDEFLNYPGWQQGEYQAFMEWVRARGIRFEYLGFCHSSQQVAVRITG